MRIKPATAVLIGIVIAAAVLRLWGITDRGVYDYDEAWYLLEAKTLYYTGDYLLSTVGLSDVDTSQGLKAYVKARGTVPMTSVKPGHTIPTFLGMVVLGTHDYAGLGISALSGILTVLLVYAIGTELGGRRMGLAAALILAVSPLHIHYSRSMYSQSNAVFFATLGAWLWLRVHTGESDRLRPLFAAGCAVGYAFTCHFNLAWVTIGFVLIEAAANRLRGIGLTGQLRRLAAIGAGMALPALSFEAGGRIAKALSLFPQDYPTYLGQFLHRQNLGERIVFSARQVPFWTDRLLATEGLLVAVLFAVGTVVLLIRLPRPTLREVTLLGLTGMALLPPSVLAVDGLYYILRNFAVALPAVALVAALGYTTVEHALATRTSWLTESATRRLVPAVCALVLVPSACLRAQPILGLQSTYRAAADRLVDELDRGEGRLATRPLSAWPIWYFYLSNEFDAASDRTRARMRFYPGETQEGDFELVDVKSYHRALVVGDRSALERYDRLRKRDPVVRLANPAADIPEAFFEGGGEEAESVFRSLRDRYRASRNIEIYDLRTETTRADAWQDNGDNG